MRVSLAIWKCIFYKSFEHYRLFLLYIWGTYNTETQNIENYKLNTRLRWNLLLNCSWCPSNRRDASFSITFFGSSKMRFVWIEFGFWSAVVFWCYHGKRCALAILHLPFQRWKELVHYCGSHLMSHGLWSQVSHASSHLGPGWGWPGAWLAVTSLAFWRESLPVLQPCCEVLQLGTVKGHVGQGGLKEQDLELKCLFLLKGDACYTTQRYWEKNRFVHPWAKVPAMFLQCSSTIWKYNAVTNYSKSWKTSWHSLQYRN